MHTRARLHYLFAAAMLTVYGGQVCPFVDSLSLPEWTLIIAVQFLAAYALRAVLLPRLVLTAPITKQVKRQFFLDLSIFIAAAIAVGTYNALIYGFPAESGGKLFVGWFIIGFLVAADLGLEREKIITDTLVTNGQVLVAFDTFVPLTRKFALLATVSSVLFTVVIFLVINKDLSWIISLDGSVALKRARLIILGELFFVCGVLLALIINLIFSFARNLRMFFTLENSALDEVTRGNLNAHVPVSSTDEFGLMARQTNRMIYHLYKRTRELEQTQEATITSLASLAETRDNETGGHIRRTQRYIKVLAEHLAEDPRHAKTLTPEHIRLMFMSAPLHDIGKVGVRDAILLKPGKLTDTEFAEMKHHPAYGRDAILRAEETIENSSFLVFAREIAYTHHERWDGKGYPQGLKGDDIPLAGRLMAIADVYDALISKRVYKPAFPHEKARDIIIEGRGTQFDPAVVDAFIAKEAEFIRIAREFADSGDAADSA